MKSLRFALCLLVTGFAACACKDSGPEESPSGSSGGTDAGGGTAGIGARGGIGGSASGAAGRGGGGTGGMSGVGGSAGSAETAGAAGVDSGGEGGESGDGGAVFTGNCEPNPCRVLASGQPLPRNLVVDAEYVYWTNEGTLQASNRDGQIMKVPIAGGDPIVVAADQAHPLSIAIDGEYLYWATGDAVYANLSKMPIAGGAIETLATGVGAWSFAVDDSEAFYYRTTDGGGMMSVPIDGGSPTLLNLLGGGTMTLDSNNLYFSLRDDGTVAGLANAAVLVSMPKAGGDLTVLTTPLDAPFAGPNVLRVNDDTLYWGDDTRRTVEAVGLDGSGRRTVATGQRSPFGMALDEAYVYWTTSVPAAVAKAPLEGGDPVTIAGGLSAPWGLALDADNVYFTNYAAGEIVVVAK